MGLSESSHRPDVYADRNVSFWCQLEMSVTGVWVGWREVAAAVGARPGEIWRMERAFEHDDLARALAP